MKYNILIRTLHKLLAILIIIQLIAGFAYAQDLINAAWIITLHKSFGLTIIFIIPALIISRLFSAKLAYDPPLPLLQHIVAKLVHYGLYFFSLAMSLSGLVGSALMGIPWKIFFVLPFPKIFEINFPLGSQIFSYHYIFALILSAFVSIHILAALYHQFIVKDDIIHRIF